MNYIIMIGSLDHVNFLCFAFSPVFILAVNTEVDGLFIGIFSLYCLCLHYYIFISYLKCCCFLRIFISCVCIICFVFVNMYYVLVLTQIGEVYISFVLF